MRSLWPIDFRFRNRALRQTVEVEAVLEAGLTGNLEVAKMASRRTIHSLTSAPKKVGKELLRQYEPKQGNINTGMCLGAAE